MVKARELIWREVLRTQQRHAKAIFERAKKDPSQLRPMSEKINPDKLRQSFFTEKVQKIASTSRIALVFDYGGKFKISSVKDSVQSKGAMTLAYKNVHMRNAVANSRLACLEPILSGPNFIVHDDPSNEEEHKKLFPPDDRYGENAIKKLGKELESNHLLMLMGACLDGSFIDRSTFLALMKEKTPMNHQLGKTLSSMPMYSFPKILNGTAMELSRILDERVKQLDPSTEQS